MRRGILASLVAAFVVACGARTTLFSHDDVGTIVDEDFETGPPSKKDASFDAIVGPACSNDSDCVDSIACTRDRCDPTLGRCVFEPNDVACDDAIFCNGGELCNPASGCVSIPSTCDDGIACTHDSCDEGSKDCQHAPDDALCPLSHGCDPALGCQARALAHSPTDLYEVKLPSGIVRLIGATTEQLTDIALHPNGTLYGVTFNAIVSVDTMTGKTSTVAPLAAFGFNGLDSAPDGTLYGSSGNVVYRIDRTTGATTEVATFPPGLASSGDLVFLGGQALATANGGAVGDVLVSFDLALGTSRIVGDIGFDCVYGLAAFGPTLYGLTCNGNVIVIDAATGAAKQVSKVATVFWGATAR